MLIKTETPSPTAVHIPPKKPQRGLFEPPIGDRAEALAIRRSRPGWWLDAFDLGFAHAKGGRWGACPAAWQHAAYEAGQAAYRQERNAALRASEARRSWR